MGGAGVFGLLMGVLFLQITLRFVDNLSPALRPFALAAWAAAVSLSLWSYDIWTDSLFAAFALTAFAFAGLMVRLENAPKSSTNTR